MRERSIAASTENLPPKKVLILEADNKQLPQIVFKRRWATDQNVSLENVEHLNGELFATEEYS